MSDQTRDVHDRALELAAIRVGESLPAADDAWLEAHLVGCVECTDAAADFHAQRSLFAPARRAFPEPPRDLWARTAGQIEAERMPRRRGGLTRLYAPLAGAMVVAIAVGLGLLNGLPATERPSSGDEPDATPFALIAGEVQVVRRNDDGQLELHRQPVDEVCPLAAQRCGVDVQPETSDTELLSTAAAWDAIISPSQDQVVVVEQGDGAQGVYVLQVPGTTAVNPTPEVAASASPVSSASAATPSEAPAATATPEVSDEPAASEEPAPSASDGPAASDEPAASETPSERAATEPPASDAPAASPTEPAASAAASPAATPRSTPDASIEPTPSVGVTPRPDGAVEIASNVRVVGSTAAYSPDGTRFAFTARPARGEQGPDVYVWTVGDARATALTSDHSSVFAGWLGKRLLVSRVTANEPRTVELMANGKRGQAVDGAGMWRPTVSPDGNAGVWWDGTVRRDPAGRAWLPDRGQLVLGAWPARGSAQVLAGRGLTDWSVAWDEDGTRLAVWTTTADAGKPGALSLYTVDADTGRVDLDHPQLDNAPAFGGFSLRDGRLTWSAPAGAGDTTVQVLAWQGDKIGRFELQTEDATTVVR